MMHIYYNNCMKKNIVTVIFIMISSITFSQNFTPLSESNEINMKYQIIEDFNNGREYWEFFENNIKYVFMKTNIYSNPNYIYFEYDMILKKRIKVIEGEQAVWIQEERSITCPGINRIFIIESTEEDK